MTGKEWSVRHCIHCDEYKYVEHGICRDCQFDPSNIEDVDVDADAIVRELEDKTSAQEGESE